MTDIKSGVSGIAGEPAGVTRRAIGWKLDRDQRTALIAQIPPRYAFAVADHVTLAAHAAPDVALPPDCSAAILARVDDGQGVEALVVTIDGTAERPGGGTFHITWSLAPTRRAAESNDVLARLAATPFPAPIPLRLYPARF